MKGQGFEIREVEPGGPIELRGYAATFNQPYAVGSFEETIKPGAFKRSLNDGPDVSLLVNHSGLPLARTTSGTMTLSEDVEGLLVEAELDQDDPDSASVIGKMKRGDLTEMSFGFRATRQEWSDDKSERTIREASLYRGDVSIVSAAANQNATAMVRAEATTPEQRQRVADRVGDRLSGPSWVPDSKPARQKRSRSYVEEAKLRRMRSRRAAATLPPHNPPKKYTFEEVQKLGKQGEAFKKKNGVYAWPLADGEDLRNAIHAIGRAPDDERLAVKRFILIRAEALHRKSMVPEEWIEEIAAASPHGLPR